MKTRNASVLSLKESKKSKNVSNIKKTKGLKNKESVKDASYRDLHNIGRRKSTSTVVTYSLDSRLFFDVYAKFNNENLPKDRNIYNGLYNKSFQSKNKTDKKSPDSPTKQLTILPSKRQSDSFSEIDSINNESELSKKPSKILKVSYEAKPVNSDEACIPSPKLPAVSPIRSSKFKTMKKIINNNYSIENRLIPTRNSKPVATSIIESNKAQLKPSKNETFQRLLDNKTVFKKHLSQNLNGNKKMNNEIKSPSQQSSPNDRRLSKRLNKTIDQEEQLNHLPSKDKSPRNKLKSKSPDKSEEISEEDLLPPKRGKRIASLNAAAIINCVQNLFHDTNKKSPTKPIRRRPSKTDDAKSSTHNSELKSDNVGANGIVVKGGEKEGKMKEKDQIKKPDSSLINNIDEQHDKRQISPTKIDTVKKSDETVRRNGEKSPKKSEEKNAIKVEEKVTKKPEEKYTKKEEKKPDEKIKKPEEKIKKSEEKIKKPEEKIKKLEEKSAKTVEENKKSEEKSMKNKAEDKQMKKPEENLSKRADREKPIENHNGLSAKSNKIDMKNVADPVVNHSPLLINAQKRQNLATFFDITTKSNCKQKTIVIGSTKKFAERRNIKEEPVVSGDVELKVVVHNHKKTKKHSEEKKQMLIKLDDENGDNGESLWEWDGEPFRKQIQLQLTGDIVERTCYNSIRHSRDDIIIRTMDCVMLRSSPNQEPFLAKITVFYLDEESGKKMMTLLWYYRPEHTEQGRLPWHTDSDVYASRHLDNNSVDCIEDKAFVLPVELYSRFMAYQKRQSASTRPGLAARLIPVCGEDAITSEPDENKPSAQIGDSSADMFISSLYYSINFQNSFPTEMTNSNVFVCRGLYDINQRKITRNVLQSLLSPKREHAESCESIDSAMSISSCDTEPNVVPVTEIVETPLSTIPIPSPTTAKPSSIANNCLPPISSFQQPIPNNSQTDTTVPATNSCPPPPPSKPIQPPLPPSTNSEIISLQQPNGHRDS